MPSTTSPDLYARAQRRVTCARIGRASGGLDAGTATDAIDVAVPAGLPAAVRAQTTSGTVRVQGLPLALAACGSRFCVGALGSGGTTLRAATTTGDIILRRL